MYKKNTIAVWVLSLFSLLISFGSGVYVQYSKPIIEYTKIKPDTEIVKIKQKGYASILSSFDETSTAIENNNPTEIHINKIRKAYYEIELFLPKEYRHHMQKSIENTIGFLISTPQQKESYLSEKRQLRLNLQNMLELKSI